MCAVKPDKKYVVIIVITTSPVSKQGPAAQGGSPYIYTYIYIYIYIVMIIAKK